MDARILLSLMWLVILSLVLSFRQNYSIYIYWEPSTFYPPTFCVAIILSTSCPKKFCSDIKSLPILRITDLIFYSSEFPFVGVGCLEVPRLSDYFDRCLNVWQSLIHCPPHPLFCPLCPNWVKDNERAGHPIGWNLGLLGFACSSTACCSIISPPELNPPAPPHRLSPSYPYNTNTPDDTQCTIQTLHDSNHLCAYPACFAYSHMTHILVLQLWLHN